MTEPIVPGAGSPPRRRWHPAVLPVVAVLALGGAGWSIWSSVGDEAVRAVADYQRSRAAAATPPSPAPAPPAADRPLVGDDPASWTEVAVFRAGPKRPRAVVVFHRPTQAAGFNDGIIRGAVAREIVRQALILAARDGFDAVVRDLSIGDPDEAGPPDATYRLGTLLQDHKRATGQSPPGARITIVDETGKGRKVDWHRMLDLVGHELPKYAALVGEMEALARTDFRAVLAGWKLPPRKAPSPPERPDVLPAGVEARLGSLAETDQFAAIRALHDAVRHEGGSPTRWRALARGYAMLGSLTEPLLSAAHAVFKARSLLYAQQAVVVAKDSPATLRDQAFAEAVAGIIFAARSDLDLADKADGGRGIAPRSEITRAYVQTNPEALAELAARDPADPLPLYLRAVVESRLSGDLPDRQHTCRNEIIGAAEAVLALVPDCHRAVDMICDAAGVAGQHQGTTIDLEAFAETSARRVAAVPDLPPAVAQQIGANPAEADEFNVRQALVKAAIGDGNDLSWGVLAQQLRDIRFLQVARRLYFLTYLLNSGTGQFVEEARPMVADHPNHAFVDLYAGTIDRAQGAQIIDDLDLASLERKNYSVVQRAIRAFAEENRMSLLYQQAAAQADWGLVPSLEGVARDQKDPAHRAAWGRALMSIDPNSPVARDLLADADWARYGPEVDAWEREQPWNTSLIADHAHQLLQQKRYVDAIPRFETAMGRSPESWIYEGLAACYREQGQLDRWVELAEALMEQPDQGLDHAKAADDLAKYLMKQGDLDRAWPWAERGAESWAGWAMNTAWKCAERRRDWPNAEIWVARGAQRYGNEWLDWLLWSIRTEHGHVPEAAALVWAQWDAGRRASSEEEAYLLAQLGLICDRPDVTRTLAEQRLAKQPTSTGDLADLALACDRLRATQDRDAAMDRLVREPNPTGPKTAKILATLIDWYRHRDASALAATLAQVDATLGEVPAEHRPPIAGLVGHFLIMFRQPEDAIRYLHQADDGHNAVGSRLLARHTLQARNEPRADNLYPPGKEPNEPKP